MDYKLEKDSKDNNFIKICKICGKKLHYSSKKGLYYCMNCDYQEKDTFGKIKSIIDVNPNLSKPELAMILDISLKELNTYFDDDNNLVNPKASRRNVIVESYDHRTRSCPYCGATLKHYDPRKPYVCPKCGNEEESDIKKVKDFLYDNGSAPSSIISQATMVPEVIIDELLESGEIQLSEDSTTYLKCKVCGASIRTGSICASCSKKELKKLKGIYAEQSKHIDRPASAKWRFVNSDKHF